MKVSNLLADLEEIEIYKKKFAKRHISTRTKFGSSKYEYTE